MFLFVLWSPTRGSIVSSFIMHNVNDMLQKLCDKRLGCYIGDVFCGCVMYADDLVLVSASVNLLQKMIDICREEAVYLDMKFSALKSNIIRIGPRCSDLSIELFVDSVAIPCVNRVRYLGIYLLSARSFKVCWQEPKKKFFRAVSGLLSKCTRTMNDAVLLHLLNLWSPYGIGRPYIFSCCGLFFLSFFLSSPNLGRRRLDVCHTSTHGVALVRI